MEGVATIKNMEAAPVLNLMEVFAEQEFTIFGVTGSLSQLAGLCPKDLSGKTVSQEIINDFVVKVANEAGIEIDPQYEPLFTETLDRHGLERKFVVAAVVDDPQPTQRPEVHAVDRVDRVAAVKLTQAPDKQLLAHSEEAMRAAVSTQAERLKHVQRNAVEASVRQQPALREHDPVTVVSDALPAAKIIKPPVKPLSQIILPKATITEIHTTNPSKKTVPVLPIYETKAVSLKPELPQKTSLEVVIKPDVQVLDGYTKPAKASLDHSKPDVLSVGAEMDSAVSIDLELVEGWTIPQAEYVFEPLPMFINQEIIEDVHQEAQIDWEEELGKDPLELYQDFTDALFGFEETMATLYLNDEAQEIVGWHVETDEFGEVLSSPPIVSKVAERLNDLDTAQKELVAPILQDIVGAIHGIRVLEAKGVNPQAIEAVEAQLRDLCVILFDALGIDYEPEDIDKFMQVMLRPEFRPVKSTEHTEAIDLTRAGTHEAKRFIEITNDVTQSDRKHTTLLGMLAVLNASIIHAPYSSLVTYPRS